MPSPASTPSQTEVEAIDNLTAQVQLLQLQVAELNSNLVFDADAFQLGLYYSILFFTIGLVFGLVTAMLRRSSK